MSPPTFPALPDASQLVFPGQDAAAQGCRQLAGVELVAAWRLGEAL